MELQYPAPKRPPLRLTSLSSPNLSPLQTRAWPPATVLDDNWYLQPPQQQHRFHHGQHHASSISPASVLAGDSSHLEEAMWQSMTLQSPEEGDYSQGPFPERPTEPDCHYYMRTGNCAFGMSCRYNHPPNRKLAVALARDKGEYPERPGQPECQYYLKTGTCKFGLTCKYHHPKERAGSLGRATMNSVGLPLRLGEKDCAFYMRTGTCKFGSTCKFNHPQPAGYRALVTMSGSSLYASGSPSAPSPQPYHTGLPSWSISRGPFMTGSRFQSPSSFAPVIVPPQSLVSVPGWSTYQVQMGPVASLDVQQQALGANIVYGGVPSVMQSSSLSKDNFPERPGQPECQYYVKTGDCKFGMSCRYHHPKERVSSAANCTLSPLGLPLRPGVAHCAFYMRYGLCKFGQTCKFDHPMGSLTYSPSASSLTDWPVAPSPMALSLAYVPPSPESSMLRPKIVLKESANVAVENREFKENYLNGSASGIIHRRSETASSNHSSHSDSADSRVNLGEASINASL